MANGVVIMVCRSLASPQSAVRIKILHRRSERLRPRLPGSPFLASAGAIAEWSERRRPASAQAAMAPGHERPTVPSALGLLRCANCAATSLAELISGGFPTG